MDLKAGRPEGLPAKHCGAAFPAAPDVPQKSRRMTTWPMRLPLTLVTWPKVVLVGVVLMPPRVWRFSAFSNSMRSLNLYFPSLPNELIFWNPTSSFLVAKPRAWVYRAALVPSRCAGPGSVMADVTRYILLGSFGFIRLNLLLSKVPRTSGPAATLARLLPPFHPVIGLVPLKPRGVPL